MQNPRPFFDEIIKYYTEDYAPFNVVGSSIMRILRKWLLEYPSLKKYKKRLKTADEYFKLDVSLLNFFTNLMIIARFLRKAQL